MIDLESGHRVLVVDDEENITDLLSTSLRFQGFEVETASSGYEALSVIGSLCPELVLLDIMMPGIDGLEVCRRLRSGNDMTPVIFLSAKDAKEDVLDGFAKGCDDYIQKPFGLEEVVARINAVLQRTAVDKAENNVNSYEDLFMDEDTYKVTRGREPIDLSPTEFRLLRYLMHNAGLVVSKTQILDQVWQGSGCDANLVETYISYLRKKIDFRDPKLIQTIRGIGYSLRSEEMT